MIKNGASKNKSLYIAGMTIIVLILTIAALSFSIFYGDDKSAIADVTAPKILIIDNNDTYVPGTVTGGTSATNMQTYLAGQGFDVTVLSETANPNTVNASYASTADTYDLVIFTMGVGHRSTTNGKQGLNANDLAFLKEYLNITNVSGGPHKAKLIIEGEDIWYDISLVGTSTDALNVLKINTSSSRADRGRITQLKVLDAAHRVNEGLAASAPTSYQTTWQDALVATTGALIVDTSTISGRTGDYGAINTFDDGAGHRRVFMPFAWYANASNLITNQTWRERLLLNAVKWVGERKVTVTASNLATPLVAPGSLEEFLDVTLTAAWGDTATPGAVGKSGISGMKVTVTGTHSADPAAAISNVIIYDDLNNNGIIDGGEPELGSSNSFVGSTCTVNFTTPFALAAGSAKNLIVAYQLTGVTSGTVGVRLADNAALVLHSSDYLAKTYGVETALSSVISTITASGTAEILSPANNATIGGFTNITGSSSGEYWLEYSPGFNSSGPWTEITHNLSAVNNSLLGTWNTTALANGGYTLRLRLLSGAVTNINVTTDNTPPVISATSAAVQPIYATISWTTDESSTSRVVYKLVSGGPWYTVNNTALVLSHSVQISPLESNTDYQYYVQSTDAVGNEQTSSTYNFTTPQLGAYAEITSPAITGQVIPRVGGTVDITGTAKTDRGGGTVSWAVYYGQGTDSSLISNWILLNSSTSPVVGGTLYSWDTSSMENSNYVLKLVVQDTGISGPTALMEDSVQVIVDNTPPIIANVRVVRVSNVSADLAWDTNKETTDVVQYGTTSAIYPSVVTDTDGDRKVFISGLTSNTTYYFKVTASDSAGHSVSSGEYSFTTTNIADATIPSVVYCNLVATGRTDTTIDLAWSAASDNTGIAAYRIWRSLDGSGFVEAGIVSATVHTFTDTGLDPNTTYFYRLTALDEAGNESVPSNTIHVPTVGAFRINPHGAYPKLTGMCVKCHHTHRGQKSMLFNDTQEQKVCFSCHNGTGSLYDIQSEYDPEVGWESRHPMPMMNTGKECASCHNPHLSAAEYPKLLSATKQDGTIVSSGPQFCLVCHGDEVVNKMIYDIGGSHQPYIGSVHDEQMVAPSSGTGVTCTNCHRNHSSEEVRLTKDHEEHNCYQCHSSTGSDAALYSDKPPAYQTVLFSVYDDFQKLSHHKIENSDTVTGDGSRLECVNCHNPHYITDDQAANRKIISDPNNTNETWLTTDPLMGDISEFCIRCHDTATNDPAKLPQQQVDDVTVVPYTVKFPDSPATVFTNNGGGWNKDGPLSFMDSGHYNNTTLQGQTDAQGFNKNQCTLCHDWHGTDYKWMVNKGEDTSDTGETAICLQCHGPANAGTFAKPASITSLDIKTALGNTFSHPTITAGYSGRHSNTEEWPWNTSGVSRHAQCYDCHDMHTVTGGTGSQIDRLGNVAGVKFDQTAWDSWASATATRVDLDPTTNNRQAYLCYKCHSKYAGNQPNPTPSSSGYTPGVFAQTDVAMEFNPSNKARHVVEGTSDMPTFSSGGNTYYYGKFVNGWTATSVMKCTDCHMPASGAKGPHGSSTRFILKAAWTPTQGATMTSSDLCFLCHDYSFYYSGGDTGSDTVRSQFSGGSNGYNGHATKHKSGKQNNCSNCHGGLPHGWKYTDSSGGGQALWGSNDARPYKDGSYLGDIPTQATKPPEQWTGQHSGTSCGGTGGCT